LTLAQKVDAEKAEEHPYYQYISTILGHIGETVLFAAMLAVMKHDEEMIEQMMGKELEQMDYMDGVPEPVSEPKDIKTKLMDDKVRRAKLLKVKNELERQLGDKFKGGSQWFYVYKLLAEMHVYADRSYVLFEADMNEIKVQVNTNTYTRKYAQLKENTTYPYWKPATGCKTATVEEGKRIAGIAYDIMNK